MASTRNATTPVTRGASVSRSAVASSAVVERVVAPAVGSDADGEGSADVPVPVGGKGPAQMAAAAAAAAVVKGKSADEGGKPPPPRSSSSSSGGRTSPKQQRKAPPPPIAVAFDEPSVPAFLLKLYTMLEDPNSDDIIGWSQKGDTFIVYNPNDFANLVLPQFFKHSNFQSFIRQLNLYGFHKIKQAPDWHEFTHPTFKRAHKHLLKDIKRKIPANGKSRKGDKKSGEDYAALRVAHVSSLDRISKLERQNQLVVNENRVLWKEVWNMNDQLKAQGQKIEAIVMVVGQMLQGRDYSPAAANPNPPSSSSSSNVSASSTRIPSNPATSRNAEGDAKRAQLQQIVSNLRAGEGGASGALAMSHVALPSDAADKVSITQLTDDEMQRVNEEGAVVGLKRLRESDMDEEQLMLQVRAETKRRKDTASEEQTRSDGAPGGSLVTATASSGGAPARGKQGGFGQWLQVDQTLKKDQAAQIRQISEMEESLLAGGYSMDESDLTEFIGTTKNLMSSTTS